MQLVPSPLHYYNEMGCNWYEKLSAWKSFGGLTESSLWFVFKMDFVNNSVSSVQDVFVYLNASHILFNFKTLTEN